MMQGKANKTIQCALGKQGENNNNKTINNWKKNMLFYVNDERKCCLSEFTLARGSAEY